MCTSLIEKYIHGLKKAYRKEKAQEEWNEFEAIYHGASEESIEKLKALYPECPPTLIELFEHVDGTYYRKYKDKEICFYLLGSDIERYPYYLLSVEQVLTSEVDISRYCAEDITRESGAEVDDRITNDPDNLTWMHFSDCMNNGGASMLFVDFTPSPSGKKGQIVRFLHDPDSYVVIAESFDAYLENVMYHKYDFVHNELFF